MKTHKFKFGDKVEIIDDIFFKGITGKVIGYRYGISYYYEVLIEKGVINWFYEENLKKVRRKK